MCLVQTARRGVDSSPARPVPYRAGALPIARPAHGASRPPLGELDSTRPTASSTAVPAMNWTVQNTAGGRAAGCRLRPSSAPVQRPRRGPGTRELDDMDVWDVPIALTELEASFDTASLLVETTERDDIHRMRSMAESLEVAAIHTMEETNAYLDAGFRNPTAAVKAIAHVKHADANRKVGLRPNPTSTTGTMPSAPSVRRRFAPIGANVAAARWRRPSTPSTTRSSGAICARSNRSSSRPTGLRRRRFWGRETSPSSRWQGHLSSDGATPWWRCPSELSPHLAGPQAAPVGVGGRVQGQPQYRARR